MVLLDRGSKRFFFETILLRNDDEKNQMYIFFKREKISAEWLNSIKNPFSFIALELIKGQLAPEVFVMEKKMKVKMHHTTELFPLT